MTLINPNFAPGDFLLLELIAIIFLLSLPGKKGWRAFGLAISLHLKRLTSAALEVSEPTPLTKQA